VNYATYFKINVTEKRPSKTIFVIGAACFDSGEKNKTKLQW